MNAGTRFVSALIVLALLGGLILTAVRGSDAAGENSESLFSRRETIRLWYTDDAMTDFLNDACVAYADTQSRYRAEPVLIDDTDYVQKIYDASTSSEEDADYPDLFIAGNDQLERLWLTGLASEVEDQEHFQDNHYFCQPAVNAVTYQGRILAYPFSFEAAAFLYNTDDLQTMADNAGQTLEETVPGTMIDVINLADSYDAPSGVEAVLKWDVSDIFDNYCFVGDYMEIGGETGDDADILHVYNQQLISCLQVYQQLNQFFSIDPASDHYEQLVEDFSQGKIVFTLATSDAVRKISDYGRENGTSLHYGVTAIPDLTGDLKSKTLSITNGLVVNGYSARRDAANAFAQYLVFSRMGTFFDQTGKAPALSGLTFSDEHLQGFCEAYQNSAPITKLRSASNFWMLLENTFSEVWDGEDPNEQLRVLAQQLLVQITGQDNVTVEAIENPPYVNIQAELGGGE